jgi:hypothetical protein
MLKRLLFAVLMAFACLAQATVYSLPWGPKPQFVDTAGAPMTSGTLTFYAAGTTTLQDTYTDSTAGSFNQNPMTLNSRGEPVNEIWLTGGASYKIVLKDSSGATIWTVNGISGVNDVTSQLGAEWVASGLTPTFVSATSFTVTERPAHDAARRQAPEDDQLRRHDLLDDHRERVRCGNHRHGRERLRGARLRALGGLLRRGELDEHLDLARHGAPQGHHGRFGCHDRHLGHRGGLRPRLAVR